MTRTVHTASLTRVAVACSLLVLLSSCELASIDAPSPVDGRPMRVVSLDVCADQYVMKLLDPAQILAVSPDATSDFSYLRERARGLRQVRPVAEDVLVLKPDLIVRAYGGGPGAAEFFRRAGIPVLSVGWANSVAEVVNTIERLAEGLGVPERGEGIVLNLRARLAQLPTARDRRSALYMTPAGVTTGPGSLIHEILVTAGLENYEKQPGWHPLPLERLAYTRPDMVAAAFFDSRTNHPDGWSPMRHPVARSQMSGRPTVSIPGAWTACAGWYLMDAVEALADRTMS